VLSSSTISQRPLVVWTAAISGWPRSRAMIRSERFAFHTDHRDGADASGFRIRADAHRETLDRSSLGQPVDPVLHRTARDAERFCQRGDGQPRILAQQGDELSVFVVHGHPLIAVSLIVSHIMTDNLSLSSILLAIC